MFEFESYKEIKLSEHFTLAEAAWSALANRFAEVNEGQLYLHQKLAEKVELYFREPYGPIKINSGQRSDDIYQILKKMGQAPSATSDHFFACGRNPFASGAWDIVLLHADAERAFKEVYQKIYKEPEEVNLIGQMIYYENRNFIHFSNSRILLLNKDFAAAGGHLHKDKFLISPKIGNYKVYRG